MSEFIAVHIGAGSHSEKYFAQYTEVCREACLKGMAILKKEGSAVEAACAATTILEDSPLVNAGIGSNLTWDGTVECDASVMEGTTLGFGGVGAVSGIRNPIRLAERLYESQKTPLSLGRVPPFFLVGTGAYQWAVKHNVETIDPSRMISEKAARCYRTLMKNSASSASANTEDGFENSVFKGALDTVGVICVDSDSTVASTCSSGGIVLKHSGRVGQAGLFGSGCWAEDNVAISTSGCGEDLIRTGLAKDAAFKLLKSSSILTLTLDSVIKSTFLNSKYLTHNSMKLCGLLSLQAGSKGGELAWAHTTQSMGIGYMSSKYKNPKCRISKLPEGVTPGTTAVIEGIHW